MIDYRHETFLTLAKIKNYTKTAESLHMSQPAVTQHIQYLENEYQTKLFNHEGKVLTLSEQGVILQQFLLSLRADSEQIRMMMKQASHQPLPLNFGVTLSIGEFIMPPILTNILKEFPNQPISMSMDNTETLLRKLNDGEIDFAIIEGFFDKHSFTTDYLCTSSFIPVCSPASPYSKGKISIDDLVHARLILREKGSGTREFLEQALHKHNLSIHSFPKICEIAHMKTIKELVSENLGITFLYDCTVKNEIKKHTLCKINLIDYNEEHDFTFVYLNNRILTHNILPWIELIKSLV